MLSESLTFQQWIFISVMDVPDITEIQLDMKSPAANLMNNFSAIDMILSTITHTFHVYQTMRGALGTKRNKKSFHMFQGTRGAL